MEVTIISPTFDKLEFEKELESHQYSNIDMVERAGYVPNDEKIQMFMSNGLCTFERHGGGDYEIQEEESDFDSDSPEFLDELTKQAEEFDQPPLAQYMDKLSAEEILSDADKKIESSKRESKKTKNKDSSLEDSIVNAIEKGFSKANKENVVDKAESEPVN